MGDEADRHIEEMTDLIAMDGLCEGCGFLRDPRDPCPCDLKEERESNAKAAELTSEDW